MSVTKTLSVKLIVEREGKTIVVFLSPTELKQLYYCVKSEGRALSEGITNSEHSRGYLLSRYMDNEALRRKIHIAFCQSKRCDDEAHKFLSVDVEVT